MIDWLNQWPMGIELNLSSSPLLRCWKGRGIRVQNSNPLKGNPIHTPRGFGKFINNEPNCDWRGLPWVTEGALSPFLPHYRATLKSRDENQISAQKMPLPISVTLRKLQWLLGSLARRWEWRLRNEISPATSVNKGRHSHQQLQPPRKVSG